MRSKVYLVVLALVAAGLVGWRACGGAPETAVGVTADLAGIWRTTSPGHIDRHFEIRAQEIVFGQGDEGAVTYPLVGVVRIHRDVAATGHEDSHDGDVEIDGA